MTTSTTRGVAWFDALFKEHEYAIQIWARDMLAPWRHHVAADIAQMVLTLAWEKRDELTDDPTGWLYKATQNFVLNEYRAADRTYGGPVEEHHGQALASPEEGFIGEAAWDDMVNPLAVVARRVLVLTVRYRFTSKQTALILGMSEHAVEKCKSRALIQVGNHHGLLHPATPHPGGDQ